MKFYAFGFLFLCFWVLLYLCDKQRGIPIEFFEYLNQLADCFFNDDLEFEQAKVQLNEFLAVYKAFLTCGFIDESHLNASDELMNQLYKFILDRYGASD